ncbi:hypothetical protein B296_00047880 [Ensete ventricosum]|uniref:Uncharacterized protein n=1 Tax=Ensete ventricosum TaxID=4639 RepID=A0A426XI23_ENSVE|nr:hypothetical protein B296_00047880 [Ensete ventricosum]
MWTPTAIVSEASNSGAEPPGSVSLVHHVATCKAYATASGSGCEPAATAGTTTSGPRRERRAGATTVQKTRQWDRGKTHGWCAANAYPQEEKENGGFCARQMKLCRGR